MRRGRNFRPLRGPRNTNNRNQPNNNRRRINNNSRQINNLQRKVKNLNVRVNNTQAKTSIPKSVMMGRVRYNNNAYAIQPSNFNFNSLSKPIFDAHKENVLNYIVDVLEPELSVTRNHQVKQPNLFPIPSAAIGFRDHYNIPTDANGDFFIAWNPNYLVNKQYLNSLMFVNNADVQYSPDSYSRLVMKLPVSLRFLPSYIPDVAFTKYRLVSAKIKVTYVGSNLNKSGMLYACATYDQTPVAIGRQNNDPDFIPRNLDQSTVNLTGNGVTNNQYDPMSMTSPYYTTFHNLTEKTIANGIWNKSVNVVQTNQGISCTHIPSDPTNEIFYPTGEYFGYDYKDPSNYTTANYQNTGGLGPNSSSFAIPQTQVISDQGSQLCYLLMGHGLPANTECINIQCFYNFEIIPTLTSAPFMRSATLSAQFNAREMKLISNAVKDNSEKLAIRTGNKTPNVSESFISKIARWGTYAATIGKIVATLAAGV